MKLLCTVTCRSRLYVLNHFTKVQPNKLGSSKLPGNLLFQPNPDFPSSWKFPSNKYFNYLGYGVLQKSYEEVCVR